MAASNGGFSKVVEQLVMAKADVNKATEVRMCMYVHVIVHCVYVNPWLLRHTRIHGLTFYTVGANKNLTKLRFGTVTVWSW